MSQVSASLSTWGFKTFAKCAYFRCSYSSGTAVIKFWLWCSWTSHGSTRRKARAAVARLPCGASWSVTIRLSWHISWHSARGAVAKLACSISWRTRCALLDTVQGAATGLSCSTSWCIRFHLTQRKSSSGKVALWGELVQQDSHCLQGLLCSLSLLPAPPLHGY